VYSVDNFKVVVDYGHNIGGYSAVINALKKLDAKRLIGVIGAPGDRKDDNLTELGRISGSEFDYVYIKEDKDRRGRKEGETAAILEMGVLSSGMDKKHYRVILDEGDALQAAMGNALDGDCIVIFYEDYEYIVKTITNFKNCQKVEEVKINAV
jgi:cyanophycin synthetase